MKSKLNREYKYGWAIAYPWVSTPKNHCLHRFYPYVPSVWTFR
nr:MAG TPA: hypothetical protein [Bacteriophage sp.]DAJ72818.1 MAG TPA: hypothetical protein [Caudoviricetes sp.]